MDQKLERLLLRVQKPARYTGGEYHAIKKEMAQVELRLALCFPDTYEIGMSNLGMRILYGVLNEQPWLWCERVFAPWTDMEQEMRQAGLPLFALESGDPVRDFDIFAFSLGYEMCYTTVLNQLDLAGLPVRAADRTENMPLVVAGGVCTYNAEPLAPFIDLFFLGEGEAMDVELAELVRQGKRAGWSRAELLRRAAQIPGCYVPSLYDVTYHEDGTVRSVEAREGAPDRVVKRIVEDFDRAYYPIDTVVPSTEIVHDRVFLEVFRGCIRGCRFCQAGYACRPVRAKKPETLVRQGIAAAAASGYPEMTLSSLSTSDYRPLEEVCDGLLEWCEPNGVSLSLPSLRADNFSVELMERLQHVRKSGLTFAPEAGTQRLRDVINKNVREEDVLESCRIAFAGGWNAVKLYFMLGLPTETDEDVLAIGDLAHRVLLCWKRHAANKSRGVRITVSTSCFVPKPHTAFQWEGQVPMAEYQRRVDLLRGHIRDRAIVYNWHDPETSRVEAVLARGDRRLADAVERVWQRGGRLDSWEESFSYARWEEAMKDCGLDMDFYAVRERPETEILPWSHLSVGVKTEFLLRERHRAREGVCTPDCRTQCSGCGANCLLEGGVCDA